MKRLGRVMNIPSSLDEIILIQLTSPSMDQGWGLPLSKQFFGKGTLPETNSSHLKMDGWNNFRECRKKQKTTPPGLRGGGSWYTCRVLKGVVFKGRG